MHLVDWSKIDPKYKWAVLDSAGLFVFENEPYWSNDWDAFIVDEGDYEKILMTPVMLKEQRPTEGDTQ